MESIWSDFYHRTAVVIQSYGPIVVYYVKAHNSTTWKELVGEDHRWTEIQVLQQIMQQKQSLEAVGADPELHEYAMELRRFFVHEPVTAEERMKFHTVATTFVDMLPFEDVFPLDLSKKPDDRLRQMRKLCGIFYNLASSLDLPLRWFRYYAREYKNTAKQCQLSKKRGQSECSGTESNLLHQHRHRHSNDNENASSDDLYTRHKLRRRLTKVQTGNKEKDDGERSLERRTDETQASALDEADVAEAAGSSQHVVNNEDHSLGRTACPFANNEH